MTWLRHFRGFARRYALAAAVCQLAVLCSATVLVAASPAHGGSRVAAHEECTCDHTAGVMCPMHRRSSSRPAPTNAPRWCGGADDSSFAVLPVLGALALPEPVAELLLSTTESAAPAFHVEAPRPLARPPDNPPPRAL